ncbi:unnamed protein product [Auanema sp. JU1783]|nr:unnamed protein product [Auanema sp. JU1783]
MDKIFFEKQEGMLCAQHALNMLLQQPLFTSVDLSVIAHQLDDEENAVLKRKREKSQNMNDSGFFSVQVIVKALSALGLELISIDHPTAAEYKDCPTSATAFICNMQEHWFTLRKFGGRQWFSLNSVKAGPEVLSDTYLSIYISQLSLEGYSIFVVYGDIPYVEVDHIIEKNPVPLKPAVTAPKKFEPMSGKGQKLGRESGMPTDS